MTQPLLLWEHLGTVLQCCVAHERCVLLLDDDGTLAPLVADPVTACLSPAMHQVITLLVQHPHFRVAIMSGRTLAVSRGSSMARSRIWWGIMAWR
jgi:trehalose-phosphatase